MLRQIACSLVTVLSVLTVLGLALPIEADVIVERFDEPSVPGWTPDLPTDASSRFGWTGAAAGGTKGMVTPPTAEHFVPIVIDDRAPGGTTTFLSVRHGLDLDEPITVRIEYYDESFDPLDSEAFMLSRYELASRNLKLNADPINPFGVRRGFAVVDASDVFVDFFHLDDAGNFATGSIVPTFDDFCFGWMARFLRFGADDLEGSKLTFIVNGPQGNDPEDPPTVSGDVYDEAGNFVNSFVVRTTEWSFELPATALAVGDFGTMRININALLGNGGLVFVQHSAFGRFSVGGPAECFQPPL
ncbi:MAG: hypothetical protein AAGE94_20995 [Acidobacteriota bacterium]